MSVDFINFYCFIRVYFYYDVVDLSISNCGDYKWDIRVFMRGNKID